MANDQESRGQQGRSERPRRRDRRRYLRRKRRRRNAQEKESGSGGQTAPRVDERTRQARRARRHRQRQRQLQQAEAEQLQESQEVDGEYEVVKAAFIYTHVIRPTTRESFDFRSEPFSNIGRRLEDFKIDLSPLFPAEEDATVEGSPPDDRPVGDETNQ